MEPAQTKAADYRREAERAEKLAETAPNEAKRQFYSTLAGRWRDMAEYAEKKGL
jgi:hypothetical protein